MAPARTAASSTRLEGSRYRACRDAFCFGQWASRVRWILKAVTLNGTDIADTPLDVAGWGSFTDLEVVVTDQQARLTGLVTDSRGQAASNCRVVVWPRHLKDGAVPIRYMHNAGPGRNGRYSIGSMPPGDYIAIAVEGLEVGAVWDPALRVRMEPVARRFSLTQGQLLTLDLPLVDATGVAR